MEFFDLLQKKRKEAHLINLLNQGSCNLHVTHVALQPGTENTGSQLKAIMKRSYQLQVFVKAFFDSMIAFALVTYSEVLREVS